MKIYLYMTVFLFFTITNTSFAMLHYKDISPNSNAQNFFTKGMLNYYGYLYVQAEFDFRQALLFDSQCAMCYWGLAISKKQQAMELAQPFAKIGYQDIQRAKQLIGQHPSFQHDLIDATLNSFSLAPNVSSKKLQVNYISALKKLFHNYQHDADWGIESLALYTDAMAYYAGIDDGECPSVNRNKVDPINYSPLIIQLIAPVIRDATLPDHPGLLHTYIHMNERDLTDPLGLLAAQKIPAFSQGEVAHYTHMPNHIYWRRGDYAKAIQVNLDTIKIDLNYFKHNGIGLNSYYYEYHYLHSYHFLSVLGILTNNFNLAHQNAQDIKRLMDVSRLKTLPDYRDTLLTLEHLVLARFNRWQSVLNLATPLQMSEQGQLFVQFAQALAYLNLGQDSEFAKYYAQIQQKSYASIKLSKLQTLIITYLRVAQMATQHAPLEALEHEFLRYHSDKLENDFFSMNPPLWLFPYQLFLFEVATSRADTQSAKKYHALYEKIYPHSTLGQR